MNVSIKKIMEGHVRLVNSCVDFSDEIEQVSNVIYSAIQKKAKVFWYGNGGSAADSQHIAAELVSRFKKE